MNYDHSFQGDFMFLQNLHWTDKQDFQNNRWIAQKKKRACCFASLQKKKSWLNM